MNPSLPTSPLQSFICDLMIDNAILTPPEILQDNARLLSSLPPFTSTTRQKTTLSEASTDQRRRDNSEEEGDEDDDCHLLSLPLLTRQSRWDDTLFVEKSGLKFPKRIDSPVCLSDLLLTSLKKSKKRSNDEVISFPPGSISKSTLNEPMPKILDKVLTLLPSSA